MARKQLGDRPLTVAERQARQRLRRARQEEALRDALHRIRAAATLQEAQAIAEAALSAD